MCPDTSHFFIFCIVIPSVDEASQHFWYEMEHLLQSRLLHFASVLEFSNVLEILEFSTYCSYLFSGF